MSNCGDKADINAHFEGIQSPTQAVSDKPQNSTNIIAQDYLHKKAGVY
jgi:hypothetical protein